MIHINPYAIPKSKSKFFIPYFELYSIFVVCGSSIILLGRSGYFTVEAFDETDIFYDTFPFKT